MLAARREAPTALRRSPPGSLVSCARERETLSREELQHLVELARGGEQAEREQALRQLFELVRRPALSAIYQVLGRCGVGREHAEEALQMACLNFLARGLEQYDGKASPATYFCRIAVRCAIDLVRRLRRDVGTASVEETPGISEAAPPPHKGRVSLRPSPRRGKEAKTAGVVAMVGAELRSDPASRARTAAALHACIEELSPTYFEAISLYCLEAIGDHATCASRVGITTEAFMQRLCRARLQLAECLAARLGIQQPLPPGRARPPHDSKARLP